MKIPPANSKGKHGRLDGAPLLFQNSSSSEYGGKISLAGKEAVCPVEGEINFSEFISFSHLMIERFRETGILSDTFAMTRRLFLPRNHEHQPITEFLRQPHCLGGLSAYSGLFPRCPGPLL